MFKFYFDKKPIVENSQRTDISVFIRHNYLQITGQMKELGKKQLDLNNEHDVKLFIELVEKSVTVNIRQENNGEASFSDINSVKVTYTKSNLEKGFIFWFICNICNRRVRYLFIPPNSEVLACRKCHRLSYRKQNESHYLKDYKRILGY